MKRELTRLEIAIAIASIIVLACLAGTFDRPAPSHLGPQAPRRIH